MSLSLSLAKKIFKLVQEKSISNSAFKNSEKLKELIDFGIVHLQVRGQKTKIILSSKEKLDVYLQKIYGINNLEAYIDEGLNPKRSRASIAQVSADTKSFKTYVQAGLYLASFENIEIAVNDVKTSIYTPNMSSLFLHKNSKLRIAEDILVVGVENFENLTSITKQRRFFNDSRKMIFMYRNKYAREFLSKSFNDYLHFGDFDLAGINIYLNDIVPRLPHERCTFFIPENISELLKYGNSKDYFTHLKKYPNLKSKSKYLQDFIDLLHKHKRSLHQEYLIQIDNEKCF